MLLACALAARAANAVPPTPQHVIVLGAAEHAAQAWEAAVAARSERTSQQHLAPWLRLSPCVVCDAGWRL